MEQPTPESTGGSLPRRNWTSALIPLAPILLAFTAAIIASHYVTQPSAPSVHYPGVDVNAIAPDFTLPDAQQHAVTLSKITPGGITVLVFYLGYDCSRCVTHLRQLADQNAELEKLGVQILAISPDTPEKSAAAIKEYGDFPFPLLADTNLSVAKSYGLVSSDVGMLHGLFIIDRTNKIRFEVRSDRPYDNLPALLDRLKKLTKPQ